SKTVLASSDVELLGNWSYDINASTVHITGDKISNESEGGTSGTLQLKLYLTQEKYDGATITGKVPFVCTFDPLAAGQYYYNIDKTQAVPDPIPDGTYYVTLCLLNYIDDEYLVTDYINF